MNFYAAEDLRAARLRLRRCAAALGGWLLALLMLYVWAAIRGARGAMLALLLAAFAGCVFAGDLWLLPARRYLKFLRGLEAGLRRCARCTVEEIGSAVELRDGARVRTMTVRLRAEGDTRVFYLNASKAAQYPPVGAEISLMSCGRHATGWERAGNEEV